MRQEVAGKNKLPNNWIDFLRNSVNKQQLFSFLSHKLESVECAEGKHIFTTIGPLVASVGVSDHIQACNHEEADTRILIHLQYALDNGATTCLVRTVDTDMIVIIASKFYDLLQQHPAADIWLAFGTGTKFISIPCAVFWE